MFGHLTQLLGRSGKKITFAVWSGRIYTGGGIIKRMWQRKAA